MLLSTPLNTVPAIKKFHLDRLKKLGIETVGDLLRHFPARYDDFSEHVSIARIAPDTRVTVEGVVRNFSSKKSWQKKLLVSEAYIADDTGSVRAIWFGQKFLESVVVPGKTVRLSGKVTLKNGEFLFQSPECEPKQKQAVHTAAFVPVYPETEGLTSKWLRWCIRLLLPRVRFEEEPIPKSIREKLHLPSQKLAFVAIHSPKKKDHFQLAQKYFAFEEMFLLQLFLTRARNKQSALSAHAIATRQNNLDAFLNTLPFSLTDDQQTAVQHILADLEKSAPMNRLLNGDVGSGKTVVAAVAARSVALAQKQTAMLAPTEVLAFQHFQSLCALFSATPFSLGLFTRNYHRISYPNTASSETLRKPQCLEAIRTGLIDIVVGTHAILEETVSFKDLALAIIDEQHRFGVGQRAALQNKIRRIDDETRARIPHFLSMTATPIPRSLSLGFFGNLDISLLETMPKNRLPIITRIVKKNRRDTVYAFLRQELRKGRQAYIILPFVEESEAFENVKAAVTEHERLCTEIFPDLALGLLHGRLKTKEKESVMRDFKKGKIQILVATSVVEVGVDVPNATAMIIENADRFGLSQLHQFRGRIGRGTHQSYCFLFASDDTENPGRRMRILTTSRSGFEIAEEDLKLRGPGQFLGHRQSGLPDIAMESMGNTRLIAIAKEEARLLLDHDPSLSAFPALQKKLTLFETEFHPE